MANIRISTMLILAGIALLFRLTPYVLHTLGVPIDPASSTVYPWNISPILPLCIFGAACYQARSLIYVIPLGIYFLGDLGIWLITGQADWAFYPTQPIVYLAVICVTVWGLLLRNKRSLWRIAGTGLAGAISFFIVSNLGSWFMWYPHTWEGLVECYTLAIPFFRHTMLSMVVFLPILFSKVTLKTVARPQLQTT
ncbi:MAG: hypothetical protein OXG05_12780 [Gammaproteobacteria bacterium]|nr:hypothetical protein [Gammaproteobacteria bacterium]